MASRRSSVWNVLLALAACRGGKLHSCGSGCLIGPSLALTATHVVDRPFDRRKFHSADPNDADFGLLAFQRVNRREDALSWRVKSAHRFPAPSTDEENDRPIDVSLLDLAPHPPFIPELEEYRRWFFEINVAPPSVGSYVTAYGFAESEIEMDSDPNSFVCKNQPVKIEGQVKEVYFPRRDHGFLPFPCFEIEGDFRPGMSGGPIFNERNQVCGIVSSGGILGVSYGTVLWPLLAVEFQGRRMLDLARERQIRVVNHQCVSIHVSKGYQFPRVEFDPRLII